MSQLVVLSDTHCQYDVIEAVLAQELARDGDTAAVLHAGDIGLYDTESSARMNVRERYLLEKHANPIHLAWPYMEGRATFSRPLIGIPGNHEDFELVTRMERGTLAPPSLRLLRPGEVITIEFGLTCLRILGLGRISPPTDSAHPRKTKYIQPEDLDRAAAAGEAQRPDVLLLHEPPALTVQGQDFSFGSPMLTRLIAHIGPRLVLAGHMHFEYSTVAAGVPVYGLGYGVKGRYAVIDEDFHLSFRGLLDRPAETRVVVEQAPPPSRAEIRLRRQPLPITAHQIIARFQLGRLRKPQRLALDQFLVELRQKYIERGGMTEAEAWVEAENFVESSSGMETMNPRRPPPGE